jgi:hypothetical protein
MKKDQTILNLLEGLNDFLVFNQIEIVDYWEADLCAVGLKKSDHLVYISTYNYEGKELKFDYDMEILDKLDPTKFTIIKEKRSIIEDEMVLDIKSFFKL